MSPGTKLCWLGNYLEIQCFSKQHHQLVTKYSNTWVSGRSISDSKNNNAYHFQHFLVYFCVFQEHLNEIYPPKILRVHIFLFIDTVLHIRSLEFIYPMLKKHSDSLNNIMLPSSPLPLLFFVSVCVAILHTSFKRIFITFLLKLVYVI